MAARSNEAWTRPARKGCRSGRLLILRNERPSPPLAIETRNTLRIRMRAPGGPGEGGAFLACPACGNRGTCGRGLAELLADGPDVFLIGEDPAPVALLQVARVGVVAPHGLAPAAMVPSQPCEQAGGIVDIDRRGEARLHRPEGIRMPLQIDLHGADIDRAAPQPLLLADPGRSLCEGAEVPPAPF